MATFDRELARLLLEICRYTYAKDFSDAQSQQDADSALTYIQQVSSQSLPGLIKGSNTSVAAVTEIPQAFVVSYMATKAQFDNKKDIENSIDDWIQDFKFLPTEFQLSADQLGGSEEKTLLGKVHLGVLEELKAVQAEIVATLKQRITPEKNNVIMTGHSQGGAEAVLGTAALMAAGFNVVSTYTFAAPRAADKNFLKNIPADYIIHRIEFGDDIVPHVPPRSMSPELLELIEGLKLVPFLNKEARKLIEFITEANPLDDLISIGPLSYGSNKSKSIRVDINAEQEESLLKDRLWSLLRNPQNWGEHHHLAGTTEEVKQHKRGNYTALVSDFALAKS